MLLIKVISFKLCLITSYIFLETSGTFTVKIWQIFLINKANWNPQHCNVLQPYIAAMAHMHSDAVLSSTGALLMKTAGCGFRIHVNQPSLVCPPSSEVSNYSGH